MATTTLLLNGFSVIGDPQKTNANASGGGEYMLHDGTALFDDDDIIVFRAENVTNDGILTNNSEITQIVVYDNAADYYNDVEKYTYDGTSDIQIGRRTMGDRYLEFDASDLTSTDSGAPVLGTITAIAGVDILGTLASQNGPLVIATNEDIDLNGDGIISGDEIGDGAFSSSIANGLVVICFAAGTLIETPDGPRFIETLKVGDAVTTLDDGPQSIRWIGRVRVAGDGENAPVRIKAGALGNVRDLVVSPNHRMLIRGFEAELLFGEPEVLVAAKHLVNGRSIFSDPRASIDYLHFLCDAHQIVFAEGCPAETLYPGQQAIRSVDEDAQREIVALFPEVRDMGYTGPMARYALAGYEARALVSQVA